MRWFVCFCVCMNIALVSNPSFSIISLPDDLYFVWESEDGGMDIHLAVGGNTVTQDHRGNVALMRDDLDPIIKDWAEGEISDWLHEQAAACRISG